MKDENEVWLVRFYYSNYPFFVTMAVGADTALIYSFIYGRYVG